MSHKPFEGKNAIITGGSRGMGQAFAVELARRGATVVITYLGNVQGANETISRIEAVGSRAHAVQANASDAEPSAIKVVDEAVNFFKDKHVDIVINNAGRMESKPFDDEHVDTRYFDDIFHANVLFPIKLVQKCRPYFRKGTRVVNVSSVAAKGPNHLSAIYAASKAALDASTRALSWDIGRTFQGTVNSINPGPVDTDLWMKNELIDPHAANELFKAGTPAGERIATVDDIVPIVAFLCDPSSRWVTANTTSANGGFQAYG